MNDKEIIIKVWEQYNLKGKKLQLIKPIEEAINLKNEEFIKGIEELYNDIIQVLDFGKFPKLGIKRKTIIRLFQKKIEEYKK